MVLRKDFRSLDVSKARVVLVEMADALLQPFSDVVAATRARRRSSDMGVEVRTRRSGHQRHADPRHAASGEELAAHTLVWAAGVQANPLAEALGVADRPRRSHRRRARPAHRRSRQRVRHRRRRRHPRPRTAACCRSSRRSRCSRAGTSADEIVRSLRGRRPRPFRYRGQGDDGHDRPPRRRRRAAVAHPAVGHAGVAGVARACTS